MNNLLASAVVVFVVVALVVLLFRLKRRHKMKFTAASSLHQLNLPPLLFDFVKAVHSCKSEDEPRYREAVAGLRADETTAERLISAVYQNADLELRPALVLAANAIASPLMFDFLHSVAASEDARGDIGHTRLAISAIDGLEALGHEGSAEALDALEALAVSANRSVQACAIAALKFSPGTAERVRRLEGALTATGREWLAVTRPAMRDVTRIDPRRHLRCPEQLVGKRPSLDQAVATISTSAANNRSPIIRKER